VSTIGRQAELARLFDSLVSQKRDDIEVLIVDQSEGQQVSDLIRDYKGTLTLRHIPCQRRGVSVGRNMGWDHAIGEIISFPDDDCWLPPGFLDEIDIRFIRDARLAGLTTNVKTLSRCDRTGGIVNRKNIFGRCIEFALFVRRELIGDLRYDEKLGVGAGTKWGADEGPDLMLRMIDRSLTIEYFPELYIFHPSPENLPLPKLIARTRAYAFGRGYLYRKHEFSKWQIARSLTRSTMGIMVACGTLDWRRALVRAVAVGSTLKAYREAKCDVDCLEKSS
jgi:glycosyltransferase involved in cell wall biosynthesis